MGEAGLVDAATVAVNFDATARVANSTGVPLEDEKAALSDDFRETLGINAFMVGAVPEGECAPAMRNVA